MEEEGLSWGGRERRRRRRRKVLREEAFHSDAFHS